MAIFHLCLTIHISENILRLKIDSMFFRNKKSFRYLDDSITYEYLLYVEFDQSRRF